MKEEERGLGSHGDNFGPFTLNGGDRLQFRDLDGGTIVETLVGAQEVVMGDEENQFSDGARSATEAILGLDMVFVGSVQSFDHLFKGSELFGFGVEVFQTDDLFQG